MPSSLQIPYESIQFDPGQRVAGSDTGMYDIYRGMYISQVVAIKKSRLFTSENGSVDVGIVFLRSPYNQAIF